MGLEATSWDWLRKGITKALPHYSLLERVENGVGVGTADVNYVLRGQEGWIELKAVELPTREDTPVLGRDGLNVDQINWHIRRMQVNARTWVFISALPYRWLVSGTFAAKVNDWPIDELNLRARFWYDENWGPTEWKRLITILTGG